MSLTTPTDFTGKPYYSGLNQMGHALLGAQIFGVFLTVFPAWFSVVLAAFTFWLWETYQVVYRNAGVRDYEKDLCYWSLGAFGWSVLYGLGYLTMPQTLLIPTLFTGVFSLSYFLEGGTLR